MTKLRQLFGRRPAGYEQATGVNHEGFPTFTRSLEERYIQTLLTNTVSHTFYVSQGDMLKLTLETHLEMLVADREFMARALVYAREKGAMRLQPIIGLAVLSTADVPLFRAIFGRVIQTPGDLLDFVQIVRGGQVRKGLGRAVKEAINGWLSGMSEYHVIKYGSNSGEKMSLRDVLRLTHPRPADERADALFRYLIDRQAWRDSYATRAEELTPQVAAVERLKHGVGPEEALTLVEQGRLPYEIVTGALKPDLALWRYLMRQMPYMALLRHLNTLMRAGVFEDAKAVEYVVERLTNIEAMRKAKILPFRLHSAWVAFEGGGEGGATIKAALERALEQAFVNMPQLAGRVAIAPDVSGSMSGSISHPSKVRYIDIAAIFTAALLRASENALVLPFETRVVAVKLQREMALMQIAQNLAKIGGGGTAVSAPVSELLAKRTPVDVFVGITDNVEWARDEYGGVGFLPTWREYRKQVAPQAQAFLITIAPYPNAVAPPDEPGVHFVYGWSDHVPGFIAQTLAGYGTQVEAVRQVQL